MRMNRLATRLERRTAELADYPDAELDVLWSGLRTRCAGAHELSPRELVEAIALVSAFSPRVLGLEPYPVQRLGALVLASGMIAEMRTGEGKTLATALAALALASCGRGVHVATANEYLAARDAAFLAPLATRLGLSVGLSRQGAAIDERRTAHASDVTYGTSSSFGFDYLYDNLAVFPGDVACRDPFAALVDEADSVLLDEAVTPLLVSVVGAPSGLNFARMASLVDALVPGRDVHVDPAGMFVTLLEPGADRLEAALVDRLQGLSLYEQPRIVQQAQTALDARFLHVNGREYIVVDDPDGTGPAVMLVDANTGRRRVSSRLRAGMHEAIEAKEGLAIRPGGATRAMISVQNFFSRYPVLGGMTGTASSAADEFLEFYGLVVLGVPTHRPARRIDHPDRVFASSPDRDAALLEEVAALRASGRPVLVACESVADCTRVGEVLAALPGDGFPRMRVLSAQDPETEAEVIAGAGEPSAVTVATAMAGRGVDIVLGGVPGSEGFPARREEVLAAGGLAVVSTCRYPSRRVDDQLRGRAGRQGEPGSSTFLLSFDEDLPRRYAPEAMRGLLASSGELPPRLAARVFSGAQAAQESEHVSARREVGRADMPLAGDRETFYAYRRRLLGLRPWPRTVSAIESAFAHTLAGLPSSTPASGVRDVLGPLWPPHLVFPDVLPAAPGEMASMLAQLVVDDLRARLSPLEGLPADGLEELLGRLVGSLVLDSLDRAWAGHLEAASSLHADTRLTGRTGQDPDRVYAAMLRRSFESMFERFFRVALTNLAGVTITGVKVDGHDVAGHDVAGSRPGADTPDAADAAPGVVASPSAPPSPA